MNIKAVVVTNNPCAVDRLFIKPLLPKGIAIQGTLKPKDALRAAQANSPPSYDAPVLVLPVRELNGHAKTLRNWWCAMPRHFVIDFDHKHIDHAKLDDEVEAIRSAMFVRSSGTSVEPPPPPLMPAPPRKPAGLDAMPKPLRPPSAPSFEMPEDEPEPPKSTAIQPFDFRGHMVRVVLADGQPQYVAKDVCEVLGLDATSGKVLDGLSDDEKGRCAVPTPGGPQQMRTVTEAGLNRLIFQSRKPEAEAVKRWLAHEVMPALRRKGYYIAGEAPGATPASQVAILESLLANAKQVEAHGARIAMLEAERSAERELRERADLENARKAEEAERKAEQARKEAEELRDSLPGQIKKAVQDYPPFRQPVQMPLSTAELLGPARGRELDDDVRSTAAYSVGLVKRLPIRELGKEASECWFKDYIRRHSRTLAKVPASLPYTRCPATAYDDLKRAIRTAGSMAVDKYNQRFVTNGEPLPESYYNRASWELRYRRKP